MSSTLLGMFAKYWQPGQTKTRLAASIGDERAARIQKLFVDTLATRFAAIASLRILACTPASRCDDFQALACGRWQVQPQEAGDLGQRMQGFFREALARAGRVVLIGSDSPDVPLAYVEQAFAALATCEVVLGPAADGGYYLIGAARQVPPLFEGIAWSTPDVWQQTIERLRAGRIAWLEMPPWYDVDDLRSLRVLLDNLQNCAADDHRLVLLREQLTTLLNDGASV